MLRHALRGRKAPLCLGLTLLLGLLLSCNAVAQESFQWTVAPSYETHLKDTDSTALSIPDENQIQHVFYDESHAILIIEGAYDTGGFARVSDTARRNENILREKLEERGFQVMVWRDLTGPELRAILAEVFANFGYRQNTRLFFYYYGHGHVMGNDSDPAGPRTFLVPIGAPDPVSSEQDFYKVALPLTQIAEFAHEITAKHAFFALEACGAGSVVTTLAGPSPPHPKGFLLSTKLQLPTKQFLTAGSADEEVLADSSFAPTLAAALEDGDFNKDGYVTGSEVIEYVTEHVPQNTTLRQNPEHGSYPHYGGGDMVFGLANPPKSQVPLPPPVVVAKEGFVIREWRSPELTVDCNRTNSAKLEASIQLDPNLNEQVVDVTAQFDRVSNIKESTGPTVEGQLGPTVVVSYGLNGLDRTLLGCPGGGHATVVVKFRVRQTLINPPTGLTAAVQ